MKYQPHDYQNYATQFIIDHPVAAILLQMGLGKSVITLTAIQKLLASREVYRVLVIAPLRVARDTWPAEIQKWDHLHGLTYSVAVGTESERRAALMLDANIHIINRENVQWLIENSQIPFEYDMIVIDELSSFKSHQSKRFKSLMKQRHRVRRIVGLTGTPSSNGLDNRMCNLRIVTHQQNQCNQPVQKNNTSGVSGVSYYPPRKKYRARIKIGQHEIHLGYYEVFEQAVQARNVGMECMFGEYGRYNDVPDAPDWLRRIVTEKCSRFAELSICEAFSVGTVQSA